MLTETYLQSTPAPAARKLIDLKASAREKPFGWFLNGLSVPLERLLAIRHVNDIYTALPQDGQTDDFCRRSLDLLGIDYALTEEEVARIPGQGPLVVVANHPFGGVEGVILTEVLLNVRPDIRILGNYLLTRIPQLQGRIISVDPFNPARAAADNARGLKQAIRWVRRGGALLTFPAGEVAHLSYRSARVVEPPWSPHIARIARICGASVLPVFIRGRNSLLFNLAGLVHPRLRTALLPREIINKKSATIELTIGKPVSWRRIDAFESDADAVNFLRFNTCLLKHRKECPPRRKPFNLQRPIVRGKAQKPIVAPVAKSRLLREIESLTAEHLLLQQKEYCVYLTDAHRTPDIMREIGRLRESSFRDAGEGTGRSLDVDTFDSYYLQLFLWNRETEEIVGAYRLGRTDRILAGYGIEGLYSATLFDYKPQLLKYLSCALELGRSFIRTEYQRKFGCLALLWRGIGAFVARNPQYRLLFGPVSISRSYHHFSKNLMVEFLKRNTMEAGLTPYVKPHQPVRMRTKAHRAPLFRSGGKARLEDVSMLVEEIEKDHKGVPTLIKHYLKLNGRFLAFNRDKAFSDVIDGLVLVDLLKTDPKIIQRFLGREESEAFYAYHNKDQAAEQAPAA